MSAKYTMEFNTIFKWPKNKHQKKTVNYGQASYAKRSAKIEKAEIMFGR